MFFRSSLNETLNVSWPWGPSLGSKMESKFEPVLGPQMDPILGPQMEAKITSILEPQIAANSEGASSHNSPSRASSRKRSTRNLMYALMGLQAHPPRDPGAYNIICADLHLILGICLANNNFQSTLRHDPKRLPRDFGRVVVEY